MITSVGVVLRCSDALGDVYRSLRSVHSGQFPGPQVVAVTDPSTPPQSRTWVSALAEAAGGKSIFCNQSEPGAVWNAGIRLIDAPYLVCMDCGDQLDAHFVDAGATVLAGDEEVALTIGGVRLDGISDIGMEPPSKYDRTALCRDFDAIDGAAMFRRRDWERLGGFDEALPTLEGCDLWLRILTDRYKCRRIQGIELLRSTAPGSLWHQRSSEVRREAAAQAICRRHHGTIAEDPAAVLFERERTIRRLRALHSDLVARRDTKLAQLKQAKAAVSSLAAELPEIERHAVDLGDLRRISPISQNWGYERGTPIDRYYIEQFLEDHRRDIRGHVLEIQEPDYAEKFGGDRVTQVDVLDLNVRNPRATIIADLRAAPNLPSDSYDCIILTQTLHVIDDMRAVVAECMRLLRPDGVLLATLASTSRVCLEYGANGDFWRVTEAGARHLFSDIVDSDQLQVAAVGNVLTTTAFIYGLGVHELSVEEFSAADPYFPLIVTVRAAKSRHSGTKCDVVTDVAPVVTRRSHRRALVLLYHRVADLDCDVHGLAVSPQEFAAQLEHLRRHHSMVSLSALGEQLQDGDFPDRSVAITFDDGYVDNLTAAVPLLESFEIPATFFLTTGKLAGDVTFWWDRLEAALLSPASGLSSLSIHTEDAHLELPIGTPEERLEAHRRVYESIVAKPSQARDLVVNEIVRQLRPSRLLPRRMTASEIRALSSHHLHSVGAHGVDHLLLPAQPDAAAMKEITGSIGALQSLLQRPVKTFAYPFGGFNDRVAAQAAACGVHLAVTCQPRAVSVNTDPLTVPRFEVKSCGAEGFASFLEDAFAGRRQ